MSETETQNRTETSGGFNREVAWRLFATEYDDSTYSFKQGEGDRAPNYVLTPTGARVNRIFVVGVVTEVERLDTDLYRARIADPTGAFVVYAGQYQPDAMNFFSETDVPTFVAVVGKARTYEPEDSEEVYTSIRPEEVNEVDSETRDRWVVNTAERTLSRIEEAYSVIEGEDDDPDIKTAIDEYGTDTEYLDSLRRECLGVLEEIADTETVEETKDDTEEAVSEDGEVPTGTGTTGETQADLSTETPTQPESTASDSDKTETETESEAMGIETETETEDEDGITVSETDADLEDEPDWDWDEGEREAVEEEFGSEFQSGTEIGSGEDADADFEDEATEENADADADAEEPTREDSEEEDTEASDSPESVVMGIIEDENGDEGVERSTIISRAVESGIDEEVADETLEHLLMDGMCYPTNGDMIKPL
ncbi:MAG: hypothetical protein SV253_04000 [Halobacteria archaeon]|nr:hypothetical protein [Halobacteria archaeon]